MFKKGDILINFLHDDEPYYYVVKKSSKSRMLLKSCFATFLDEFYEYEYSFSNYILVTNIFQYERKFNVQR